MEQYSRKKYLILPSYQLKLVGFMILVVFLGSVMHGFFLYHITNKNIQEGFLSAHNRLRSTWEILKPAIIVTNSISFLIISVFLLIITVFISHRIIGPIFKVSKRLKEVAQGVLYLPCLRLRKGDEGQVLCNIVNELQDNYRQVFLKLNDIKKELEKSGNEEKIKIAKEIETVIGGIKLYEAKKEKQSE